MQGVESTSPCVYAAAPGSVLPEYRMKVALHHVSTFLTRPILT